MKHYSNDKKVAETFHDFFSNLVRTFKNVVKNIISQNTFFFISGTSQIDSVLQSIENFSKHPSTMTITNRISNSNWALSFKFEAQKKFSKLIRNLNSNKAT